MRMLQVLSARLLGLFGWKVELAPPPLPKCVVIFYPHTCHGLMQRKNT